MSDFAKFLSVNGLKRKDIASLLGVSGAFISQITKGDRSLPADKLAIIKANAYGWDISMLTGSKVEKNFEPVAENPLIEYLQKQIEELKQKVDDLTKEKIDLIQENALLRYERTKIVSKGETAESADSSLCADAS